MSKKKHGGGGHGEEVNLERWLVSYADFMTLLFCLFVMLYSSSKVDEQKLSEFAGSIMSALGTPSTPGNDGNFDGSNSFLKNKPSVLSAQGNVLFMGLPRVPESTRSKILKHNMKQLRNQLQDTLADLTPNEKMKKEPVVELEARLGVRVQLDTTSIFRPGETELLPEALPSLDRVGMVIKSMSNRVNLESFLDSEEPPAGSQYRSGLELSSARCSSILRYLASRNDLPASRFSLQFSDPRAGQGNSHRLDIIILEPEGQPK